MSDSYYESKRLLNEYLLFHYGAAEDILPYPFAPKGALDFAVRCVSECIDVKELPSNARALDLGCAVGRSSFELSKHCGEVIGIDASTSFINAAQAIAQSGNIEIIAAVEGEISEELSYQLPKEIDRSRVRFEVGDAQKLGSHLGEFDLLLMANLIDRLPSPVNCLLQLPNLLRQSAQLIICSPYTWLEDFTPRDNWLGGKVENGRNISTLESLKENLAPDFEFIESKDLPFLIREHSRKFQWSVSQASIWRRK